MGMNDEKTRCRTCFFWQWMTNIESWANPLPKSWINRSIQLGKTIVERECALGMTPILQGYFEYLKNVKIA